MNSIERPLPARPHLVAGGAVRPRAAEGPSSFDVLCTRNNVVLGGAGNEAFRAGSITSDGLVRLLAVTLPHWRPSRRRPHKGYLFLQTSSGGLRLTHRHLVDFYGVRADAAEQRRVSGRSIQRVLQVVGAAHFVADGEPSKVEAMLLALLGEQGRTTPAGLLRTAKKTASWAACLCSDASPEAQRRRLVNRFRAQLDRGAWSREALEAFRAEIDRAIGEVQAGGHAGPPRHDRVRPGPIAVSTIGSPARERLGERSADVDARSISSR
jgi:hypothetical protein